MGESRFGRRRFLGVTAAAGAVVAGSALLGEPLAAAASGVDYAGLKRALKGSLLRPGDAGYPAAAKPFNAALGVRRPAAIARVAGADDVSTCVRRVRGHGVPLAARGGGHSYAGFSTPDNGVVVDLSALKGITVRSDGTAVVGAGHLGDRGRLPHAESAVVRLGRRGVSRVAGPQQRTLECPLQPGVVDSGGRLGDRFTEQRRTGSRRAGHGGQAEESPPAELEIVHAPDATNRRRPLRHSFVPFRGRGRAGRGSPDCGPAAPGRSTPR